MLQKIIGVVVVAAAVILYFNFMPSKAESRRSMKTMLFSIVLLFALVILAYIGISIFNGNLENLF